MTDVEMQRSLEAHDRRLDTVVGLLATLGGRLDSLVRLADPQNQRLTRLEDAGEN